MFEARSYRNRHTSGKMDSFEINWLETDLWIGIDKGSYREEMRIFVLGKIVELRTCLMGYNETSHKFIYSLEPLAFDTEAPQVIQQMLSAGIKSNTGPMSSVAGVFAKYIGDSLAVKYQLKNVIVENGGDNYLLMSDLVVELPIYAGESQVNKKIVLKVKPDETPLGICTSSGRIGHSKSFGKADAVTIVSKDIALADAYATGLCNIIQDESDINYTLARVRHIPEIATCIVILNNSIGIIGQNEVLFLK